MIISQILIWKWIIQQIKPILKILTKISIRNYLRIILIREVMVIFLVDQNSKCLIFVRLVKQTLIISIKQVKLQIILISQCLQLFSIPNNYKHLVIKNILENLNKLISQMMTIQLNWKFLDILNPFIFLMTNLCLLVVQKDIPASQVRDALVLMNAQESKNYKIWKLGDNILLYVQMMQNQMNKIKHISMLFLDFIMNIKYCQKQKDFHVKLKDGKKQRPFIVLELMQQLVNVDPNIFTSLVEWMQRGMNLLTLLKDIMINSNCGLYYKSNFLKKYPMGLHFRLIVIQF